MRSSRKSKIQKVDIADLYALKVKALWSGLKQEHASLWFLCIYFFFEYVRPQSIYTAIDILPYSQIFLGLAIISAIADPSVKWVNSAGNKYIIIFSLIIILSGIFAFRPMTAWENHVFFLNWLIVYFLVLCVLNTEKRLFLFLCAFLLFNLKMSQHGFISWMQRGFAFATWGLTGSPGWFRNSGEFALEMLIFTPLATGFVIALRPQWKKFKRLIMYMLPISGAVSIIGASSRGGQVGLAAVTIWLILLSKQRLRAMLMLSIACLALYHLLPDEQIARFTEMGSDKSSLQRLAYWEYGLQVMQDHPVLGIGYYNWLDYVNFMEPGGIGPGQEVELPHNIFIQAGAELGYTGLVSLLSIIVTILLLNRSTRKLSVDRNRFLFYLAYGLDAGFIGLLAGAMFVSVLYYPFLWVQFAITAAVHSVAKNEYSTS